MSAPSVMSVTAGRDDIEHLALKGMRGRANADGFGEVIVLTGPGTPRRPSRRIGGNVHLLTPLTARNEPGY
jgi:hypothetical protein